MQVLVLLDPDGVEPPFEGLWGILVPRLRWSAQHGQFGSWDVLGDVDVCQLVLIWRAETTRRVVLVDVRAG
jgi:hypothetical protein